MGWFSSRIITIVGFVVFSAVVWHILAGFTYRVMFSSMPLLFAAQLTLSDALEGQVMSRVGWGTKWFTLLIAPGTILHELCHMVAALVTGCTVTKAALFRPNPQTGVLGYVAYTQPKDRFIVFREFVVGFAPFFGCGLVLLIVGGLSGFNIMSFASASPASDFLGILGFAADVAVSAAHSASSIDFSKPSTLLLLYLQICFTLGASPSSVDFKGAFSSLYKHIVSALFFLAFLALMVLATQDRQSFMGTEVASAAGAAVGFVSVILILSTLLMLAVLPLVFLAFKILELDGISKTIPLTTGFLAYEYCPPGHGPWASPAACVAAAAAALTALKWTEKMANKARK